MIEYRARTQADHVAVLAFARYTIKSLTCSFVAVGAIDQPSARDILMLALPSAYLFFDNAYSAVNILYPNRREPMEHVDGHAATVMIDLPYRVYRMVKTRR